MHAINKNMQLLSSAQQVSVVVTNYISGSGVVPCFGESTAARIANFMIPLKGVRDKDSPL